MRCAPFAQTPGKVRRSDGWPVGPDEDLIADTHLQGNLDRAAPAAWRFERTMFDRASMFVECDDVNHDSSFLRVARAGMGRPEPFSL